MATFNSDVSLDSGMSIASCQAGEVRSVRGKVTLPTTLVLTDVVHLVRLPAQHVIVDAILECADLDTNGTPLITLEVGITDDTVGATEDPNALILVSTIAQGGGMARMDAVAGLQVAAVDNDRKVGVTIVASAATAAAGEVALTLLYRAYRTGE